MASAPESDITGLSQRQATERLKQYGRNAVDLSPKPSQFRIFIANFTSPLIVVLLVAAGISAYFGDLISASLIFMMVLLSAILNFVNSYKADKAAESLKSRVSLTTHAIRGGQVVKVPVVEVVVGDVIQLSPGNIIPADGQLITSQHLFLNESSLTGESFPQPRNIGATIYMGSNVTSGTGLMKVTATGAKTKFSQVAKALSTDETATEFDREMQQFSSFIIKVIVVLVLVVFLVQSLQRGDVLQSLMFAVALAVGLTPEMLPMIITLNLARGSLVMAQHGVIVKRLSAIQNFGSMDVLCTDKTGTLTENRIEVVKYVDGFGKTSDTVLKYAYINSLLSSKVSNPLDDAVKAYKTLPSSAFRLIDELPFDFERKRESVIVEHESHRKIITKGAPEEILAISQYYGIDHDKLKAPQRKQILAQYRQLSQDGFRVLAVAVRQYPEHGRLYRLTHRHATDEHKYSIADEKEMSFLGFVAFLDPPKRSTLPTIQAMQRHGITTKILTGDNELITQHVAKEIELEITGVLLGSEIDKLTDHQLSLKLDNVNLFARVNPGQKLRIVQLLRANGHVVGYIGDGINDAPALREADVGISVKNAVDVARESADFILLYKSLEDLSQAVMLGRQTFANTAKYLKLALSSNFGNVFSMAGTAAFLPFLPMLPTQILFNNLLFDSSQFSIPLDRVDPEDVELPQRLSMKYFKRFMVVFGPLSSLFDMITFATLVWVFGFHQSQFQTAWFIESIATQVFVVYVVRTRRLPFIHSRPSWPMLVMTLLAVIVGWGVALTGLGSVFGFSPLPLSAVLAMALISVTYLVTVEWVKRIFIKRWG